MIVCVFSLVYPMCLLLGPIGFYGTAGPHWHLLLLQVMCVCLSLLTDKKQKLQLSYLRRSDITWNKY